ncbi:MAG: MerR family transcriptional regulator [Chitinophagales bacterium]|nr:MerR family transcriptional regulator [Chitinophagales bacterium]
MNSFTISQLQQYSGINVHSIRAWEKRYHALKPGRSEGNTRYYDSHQLRRLLNIASLMHTEYKVSELCSFSDSRLYELMISNLENLSVTDHDAFLISQLVASALTFDELLFDKVFSRAVLRYGMVDTYVRVIYPVLLRLGIMWSADKIAPAQEHFISNLLRQKLDTSIDILPVPQQSADKWLLFLPENEFHENGLLMANYLVRSAGHPCIYLGANLPFDALKAAVEATKPACILLFLVSNKDEQHDRELIQLMLKSFPTQKIFIAAKAGRLVKSSDHPKLTLLESMGALKKALEIV